MTGWWTVAALVVVGGLLYWRLSSIANALKGLSQFAAGSGELGEKVERIQEELERIGEHLARLRESWGDDGWVYDDDEEKEEPCAPATPC